MSKQAAIIDVDCIIPGNNDRKQFRREDLEALANSIKRDGLMEPIIVRQVDTDLYRLIAGERRWRAHQLAGLTTIEAVIHDVDDRTASRMMAVENLIRVDLKPLEEAQAYYSRMQEYNMTAAEIAEELGKKVRRVEERIALLRLNEDIQKLIDDGELEPQYGSIIGNAELDPNFQSRAMAIFNSNSLPSPAWFRGVVSDLKQQQAQCSIFDLPLFGGQVSEPEPVKALELPPLPANGQPPIRAGASALQTAKMFVNYWTAAAKAWGKLGRPFEKRECRAVAAQFEVMVTALEAMDTPIMVRVYEPDRPLRQA